MLSHVLLGLHRATLDLIRGDYNGGNYEKTSCRVASG